MPIFIKDKSFYLGHHFCDQSDEHYKDNRFKVAELSARFNICFTGHDHKFNQYAPNFINLGSIRRIHFGESDYGTPKYATLCLDTLKTELCEVKSAIPMVDANSMEEALKIDSRAKLRLIFTDFETYMKNVNKLPELQKKFFKFKIKHDYITKVSKVRKKIKASKSFEEMFGEYLKKEVKNEEVKTLIEENL